MKIISVLPYFGFSGGDRVMAIYVQHLQNRGHDVLFIAPGYRPPRWRDQLRAVLKGKGWMTPSRSTISHFDGVVGVVCQRLNHHRPVQDKDLPDADVVIET